MDALLGSVLVRWPLLFIELLGFEWSVSLSG